MVLRSGQVVEHGERLLTPKPRERARPSSRSMEAPASARDSRQI
jgi:hypothetical protein